MLPTCGHEVARLRGYEHIEEKLKGVGAQIRRIGEMFPKKSAAMK